ncbi:MAG TPA: hypothetical protein VGM25_07165 [Caulobacteraceae bacterium]|jgi:hypothetical protein
MHQAEYVARWTKKQAWYAELGITRWSPENPKGRLIVTEDTMQGGIDSGAISRVAQNLFCA